MFLNARKRLCDGVLRKPGFSRELEEKEEEGIPGQGRDSCGKDSLMASSKVRG